MDTDATEPKATAPPVPSRYALGLIGLLIAIVGLVIAAAGPKIVETLHPPQPLPELTDMMAEAGDKFMGRMMDRLRGKPAPAALPGPPPDPWYRYANIIAITLGVVGVVLGVGAFVRRENDWLAMMAISIGVLAVGWVYFVASFGLVIAVIILLVILRVLLL